MEDNAQRFINAYEKRAVVAHLVEYMRGELLPLAGDVARTEVQAETPFGTRAASSSSVSDVLQELLRYEEELVHYTQRFRIAEVRDNEPTLEKRKESNDGAHTARSKRKR